MYCVGLLQDIQTVSGTELKHKQFNIQQKLQSLILSPPIPLRPHTVPYWSRTERQSAWMSKIKNDGLDQYGAEPFEQ